MSDHVLLLNEGWLAQFAPPGELFDRPVSEYVARFIGTPSTNVFPATAEASDGTVSVAGEGFRLPVTTDSLADRAGDELRVGIRPQYLSPAGGDHSLTLLVEVLEQLGTEFVGHCHTPNGTKVDVVSDAIGDLAPGDELRVGFDVDDVFVFDSRGDTICYGDELGSNTAEPEAER